MKHIPAPANTLQYCSPGHKSSLCCFPLYAHLRTERAYTEHTSHISLEPAHRVNAPAERPDAKRRRHPRPPRGAIDDDLPAADFA